MKNTPTRQYAQNQRGLTLIELMIAMALGMILIAAISTVYLSSRQTFRTNDNLSRVQESMRVGFETISREARQAAFLGCAGQEAIFNNTLSTPTALLSDFATPIFGYEATTAKGWNLTLDAAITSPLNGRDILVVRSIDEGGGPITSHPAANAAISIPGLSRVAVGDVLLATNCRSATVFKATGVSTAAGVDTIAHGSNLYASFIDGELRRISTKVFYIRNNPNGLPSLFLLNGADGSTVELIEGVDDMQIVYGVDNNGDLAADDYAKADAVQSASLWNKVVSINLTLTHISPEDSVAITAQSDATGEAQNRRLRKQISTTISLRNRAG